MPGDIVVTAQKRAESSSRIGMSIAAFSAETLRDADIRSTEDLTRVVPGFTVAKSVANTPIYNLRGVGSQSQFLSTTSPVGVYVDEVAYAYPYMANNVAFDLERVEVLKGPQGTLYGRNTTGGLVNYITARPTADWSGALRLSYGNYQSYTAEGHLSGPLTPTLGFRIAARYDGRDKGWQRSITRPGDRLGEIDRFTTRGSLEIKPSSSFNALLTGTYWQDRSDTQAAQLVGYIEQAPGFGNPAALASLLPAHDARLADWTPPGYQVVPTILPRPKLQANSRFYNLTLRTVTQLADSLSLTTVTGYNNVRRDDVIDLDGSATEILTYRNKGKITSFSQEARLSGDGARFNWIVGANYSRDKIDEDQIGYSQEPSNLAQIRQLALLMKVNPAAAATVLGIPAPAVPGFIALAQFNTAAYSIPQILSGFSNYRTQLHGTNRTWGVFGNAQWQIADTFKLNGGLRYSQDLYKFNNCAADYMGYSNPAAVPFLGIILLRQPLVAGNGACLVLKDDFSGLVNGTGTYVGKLDEDNISFRGSLEWTPNTSLLGYASVSRGYKSGAAPVLPGLVASQLAPIGQERLMAYEAGVKAKLFSRTMQFNTAGFYYDYSDKQLYNRVSLPILGNIAKLFNVPKSRVLGAEAEMTWQPNTAFTLRTAVTYLDSKVLSFTGIDEFGQTLNFRGRDFPYTPKWSGSLLATYRAPISNMLVLTPAADVSLQSSSSASLSNNPLLRINGRAVANVSLALENRRAGWEARLWARNVFDKYYWNGADYLTDAITRFAGEPRTYGLSLQYEF